MFESMKKRLAETLLGASAETMKIAWSVANASAVERLWQFLNERLQDMSDAGTLSPCDAGAIAPELHRVLGEFGKIAEAQMSWVSHRFQQNWLVRALWQADPMDLVLAMRGLEEAARVAGGEVWAFQRRLKHMQYPGSPLFSNNAPYAASPSDEAPWAHVTDIPWIPAEQVEVLDTSDLVEAVLWLDRRVFSTTRRSIRRIREGMASTAGCQLADPLAVSAAVAELDALVGFTIWFSRGIQQVIWQRTISGTTVGKGADAREHIEASRSIFSS